MTVRIETVVGADALAKHVAGHKFHLNEVVIVRHHEKHLMGRLTGQDGNLYLKVQSGFIPLFEGGAAHKQFKSLTYVQNVLW